MERYPYLWVLHGWAIERGLRVTDVPEGGFAHIGELHDEVRCADVVTEHDGRTGFRVWEAVRLSLQIALVNATFATMLGTFAGLAMVRFGRFRGRTLFGGMLVAPLVMPEVITGLSLLVFFISLKELFGWPAERGFTTITIAHITFSLAYVAVIIQARLTGIGETLEEAAADLGAKPFKVMMSSGMLIR